MIKLQGKTIATYVPSSSLKSIRIRRDRRPSQKGKLPPGYVEVQLEEGDSFKTSALRILPNENKIRAGGKSYEYDDMEGLRSLP